MDEPKVAPAESPPVEGQPPRTKRPYAAPVLVCESQTAPETGKIAYASEFEVTANLILGALS
jgi:hypothetical protein